jgi:hypothetical protein
MTSEARVTVVTEAEGGMTAMNAVALSRDIPQQTDSRSLCASSDGGLVSPPILRRLSCNALWANR